MNLVQLSVLTTLAFRGPQGTTYRRATCDHPLLMLPKLRFPFSVFSFPL